MVGDLLDFDAVYNFGKTVDLLTIEIENVNLDALDKLENEGFLICNLRNLTFNVKPNSFFALNSLLIIIQ